MRTTRLAYLLIALLLFAQADDAWAITTLLSSPPQDADTDEYLPCESQQFSTRLSAFRKPALVGLKLRTGDGRAIQRSAPMPVFAGPFGPPPLRLFMSMLC